MRSKPIWKPPPQLGETPSSRRRAGSRRRLTPRCGWQVELTYVADTPAPSTSEEDASARITLRLPERLKADAESAAARESISTNAWLVRAVSAALTQRQVGGHRLRGFASG